jgi:hypothetical protein
MLVPQESAHELGKSTVAAQCDPYHTKVDFHTVDTAYVHMRSLTTSLLRLCHYRRLRVLACDAKHSSTY